MEGTAEVRLSEETRTFAEVLINGQSKGRREINGGPSLKEFATRLATDHNIRTFTVTLNGSPVRRDQAEAPVPANAVVAVSAKDSRGLSDLWLFRL